MKHTRLLTVALALLLAFATTGVAGKGMMGGHDKACCKKGHGDKGMLDRWVKLGLDDDQIGELMELKSNHMMEVLPLKREAHGLMEEMHELGDDPAANEKALKKKAARMAEIKVELKAEKTRLHAAMMDVLTEEQKEMYGACCLMGECEGHGMKKHHKRMKKHGEMMEQETMEKKSS